MLLQEEYKFPVDQAAIYYLFDRDPKSNTDVDRIKEYIETLKNPYENENAMRAGQLLLSYPSIEGYMISCFENEIFNINLKLGHDAKEYISGKKEIQMNKISEAHLENAAKEFMQYLENVFGQAEIDIDDFSSTSRSVFDEQEKEYIEGDGFHLFSMLTLALLQLGILEEF